MVPDEDTEREESQPFGHVEQLIVFACYRTPSVALEPIGVPVPIKVNRNMLHAA